MSWMPQKRNERVFLEEEQKMKNKEKYLDEIIDVVYKGYPCNFIKNNCHFDCVGDDEDGCVICKEQFKAWLEEEYTPEPRLSHDEYVILKNTHKSYGWIARDEGRTCVAFFGNKPIKDEYWWEDDNGHEDYGESFVIFKDELFQFIKWEDEEPYNIQELLDEYEIYHSDN